MSNITKQINNWKQAATVLAFTALGLIAFGYWIGIETVLKCIIVLVCSVFFSISVIWWYWALSQIALFAKYIDSLKRVIEDLKKDLKNIRKDLEE